MGIKEVIDGTLRRYHDVRKAGTALTEEMAEIHLMRLLHESSVGGGKPDDPAEAIIKQDLNMISGNIVGSVDDAEKRKED